MDFFLPRKTLKRPKSWQPTSAWPCPSVWWAEPTPSFEQASSLTALQIEQHSMNNLHLRDICPESSDGAWSAGSTEPQNSNFVNWFFNKSLFSFSFSSIQLEKPPKVIFFHNGLQRLVRMIEWCRMELFRSLSLSFSSSLFRSSLSLYLSLSPF